MQLRTQGAGRLRAGVVSTSDSSPPGDPGAAAPAAAARSASTMHCSGPGHRGGWRRRRNPCSIHPSFLCQLSVRSCLESKALPALPPEKEGRKRKREKGNCPASRQGDS